MTLALTAVLVGIVIGVYVAYLNKLFLRCPHCGMFGTWRLDNVGAPIEEFDGDENLVGLTQRRQCRKCGGEVDDVWSDFKGRELRRVDRTLSA